MSDTETPDAPEATDEAENVDSLPEWARKALEKANRDAAKYRTKAKELEPLAQEAQQLKQAQMTSEQRLTEALQAEQDARQKAERELMRVRVIAETQLDPDLHEFVVGDTEDEMRAKAEKLKAKAAQPPPAGPRPDLSQGARASDMALNGDPLVASLKSKLGIQ